VVEAGRSARHRRDGCSGHASGQEDPLLGPPPSRSTASPSARADGNERNPEPRVSASFTETYRQPRGPRHRVRVGERPARPDRAADRERNCADGTRPCTPTGDAHLRDGHRARHGQPGGPARVRAIGRPDHLLPGPGRQESELRVWEPQESSAVEALHPDASEGSCAGLCSPSRRCHSPSSVDPSNLGTDLSRPTGTPEIADRYPYLSHSIGTAEAWLGRHPTEFPASFAS
jgi:hypothetical protein